MDRPVLTKRRVNNGSSSDGSNEEKVDKRPLHVSSKKNRQKATGKGLLLKLIYLLIFLVTSVLLLFGIICPVVFQQSLTIRKGLLFMNWLNLPLFKNLSNPETEYGMNCTRNFYIPNSNLRIGVWHILPANRIAECDLNTSEKISSQKAFADSNHVILYLHGNGGARGGNHRRELYKVLAYNELLNYHVVAIDYRGYGDSSPIDPNSSGLVEDARIAYDWLVKQLNGKTERLTVWGHSLGTAVSVHMIAAMDKTKQPSSLVLEAPFSSLPDAVKEHPLAKIFTYHPFFEKFFVEPLMIPETHFDSSSHIKDVHCPIMILHAKDDGIIPYPQGVKLFKKAEESHRSKSPAPRLISYDAELKYGHKAIFRDPQLAATVNDFIQTSLKALSVEKAASKSSSKTAKK